MENSNTISITDIVNLIIDKKVKIINDTIAEKNALIRELKKKHEDSISDKAEKLQEFFYEHFDASGLAHFMYVMKMTFRMGGMFIGGNKMSYGMGNNNFNSPHQEIFKEMYLCGLTLKDTDIEYDAIDILNKEIDKLENQRYQIKNSKDALIAEVTLQQLSNIDVNFGEKLDLLADRIFNKQEPKLINND